MTFRRLTPTSLKDNKQYADLTIRLDRREWQVHRLVVCPESDFLKGACSGHFQVRKIKQQSFHARSVAEQVIRKATLV